MTLSQYDGYEIINENNITYNKIGQNTCSRKTLNLYKFKTL